MPVIKHYTHFGHINPEVGTLANVLANTLDAPGSEAVLFGISGGIVAGYTVSETPTPHLHFLTRNPFNPLDTIIERLKLPIDDRRTSRPDKAARYLHEALDMGQPVLVWVALDEMPYTVIGHTPETQTMQPVVVYGCENGMASISDRAHVPLVIPVADLERARSTILSERHRQMTIGAPNTARLALAVRLGIESCLRYFLEEPPFKELRGVFGLAAFQHWARLLEQDDETGWRSAYPRGRKLAAMLVSAYESINLMDTGGHGSRAMFADFLDEAALLLDKPALADNAAMWREVLPAWQTLNEALLPTDVQPLTQVGQLLQREYHLFKSRGYESLMERQQIRQEVDTFKQQIGRKFPLNKRETEALLDNIRDAVLAIHAAETAAVHDLQGAIMAVHV